ncbi:abortive infection system antitoxin AbiGi family protein [Vreelandella neptunia]|uniref:abortive infection system antitoxin AbiGi family protein n=1 Tax=Vreelandella neptunia TaxID=115551 RepID=UPI00315A89A3
MKPKSSTLFHFTKSNETLKLLLKGGFWPRYSLEDVSWLGSEGVNFVAYPMVCFCDIPLSRVDEHVKFYGEFGIGLTKEWAMSNGMTPVHYISPNSDIPAIYSNLVNLLATTDDQDNSLDGGWGVLRHLLAYTKPIEGNIVVASELIEKDFHQESEWRFIARHDDVHDFITRSSFEKDEEVAGRNNETKKTVC